MLVPLGPCNLENICKSKLSTCDLKNSFQGRKKRFTQMFLRFIANTDAFPIIVTDTSLIGY